MIKQRPGSNAREVIAGVKQRIDEIQEASFPPGMSYNVTYDVSRFLDASIHEVVVTLFEAFLLVFLVVFLFLTRFPLHAHSGAGGAGGAHRYAILYATAGLFHQPAHAVCAGAGHRHCGRQRHRGGGGGARQDGRRGPVAAGSDLRGHARDQRGYHCHHPGDVGGVRAGGLSVGTGRSVLPAVLSSRWPLLSSFRE